jgi:hypothetical protein
VTGTRRRGSVVLMPTAIIFVVLAAFAIAPSMTVTVSGADGIPPIQELPQIKVTNISFSNDNPKEGQNVTITVVIFNNGTGDVLNVSLTIAYDRTNITTMHNLTVPSHGNRTVEVTWKAIKFTHTMSAMPSVQGVPLTNAAMNKQLVVAANPIGNAYVVFAALMLVLLVFLAAVAAPSVWEHMRRK